MTTEDDILAEQLKKAEAERKTAEAAQAEAEAKRLEAEVSLETKRAELETAKQATANKLVELENAQAARSEAEQKAAADLAKTKTDTLTAQAALVKGAIPDLSTIEKATVNYDAGTPLWAERLKAAAIRDAASHLGLAGLDGSVVITSRTEFTTAAIRRTSLTTQLTTLADRADKLAKALLVAPTKATKPKADGPEASTRGALATQGIVGPGLTADAAVLGATAVAGIVTSLASLAAVDVDLAAVAVDAGVFDTHVAVAGALLKSTKVVRVDGLVPSQGGTVAPAFERLTASWATLSAAIAAADEKHASLAEAKVVAAAIEKVRTEATSSADGASLLDRTLAVDALLGAADTILVVPAAHLDVTQVVRKRRLFSPYLLAAASAQVSALAVKAADGTVVAVASSSGSAAIRGKLNAGDLLTMSSDTPLAASVTASTRGAHP